MIFSICVSCSYITQNKSVGHGARAYQRDLLSVLLLGDLSSALLVLVGSHDLLLQLLEFVGLCADSLNFLLLPFIDNLELGHLASEGILDLGRLGWLELLL